MRERFESFGLIPGMPIKPAQTGENLGVIGIDLQGALIDLKGLIILLQLLVSAGEMEHDFRLKRV